MVFGFSAWLEPVAVLKLADTSLGDHTFSYFHLECCVLSFPLLVVSLTSSLVEWSLGWEIIPLHSLLNWA